MVIKKPIKVKDLPASIVKDPMTPFLYLFPIENSAKSKGMDQISKKKIQSNKKAPPYWPASLGNRQRFPAPIAMPNEAKIIPHRLLNCSTCFTPFYLGLRIVNLI